MSHAGKTSNGFSTPREAAFYLEKTLSGCRHVAAAQGFPFLVYLIGMALQESRSNTLTSGSPPIFLSDQDVCKYTNETVRHLLPLMRRPRLRTLAFMLDHVRSEAEMLVSESEPG